ncbi:MAG: DinB family protein [Chitinophagaceae bacterium]
MIHQQIKTFFSNLAALSLIMADNQQTESWLSGPVEGVIPVLQPVAHAILQSQREVQAALQNFPETLLWQRPAGVASVAFHLQHLAGVLDRLWTYARGEQLSPGQLNALQAEGKEDTNVILPYLIQRFNEQVASALHQLRNTGVESVLETRHVGRKQIPSNVLGLLFHAAEHTQRHTGQLLVTARILNNKETL